MYIYIYYIHPELRICEWRSGTGKGAGPLQRKHRGSKEGASRQERGATREQKGGARETEGVRGSIEGARGSAKGA